MWTFVTAMCVLWVMSVRGTFHGNCPRKEPPPGVVVVLSGSDVVLTCSGHVIIDGVKVASNANTRHSSFAAVTHSTVNKITHNAVLQRHTVANRKRDKHTVPTSEPTHVIQSIRTKSEWDSRHVQLEDKYNEEEDRGRQWKCNGKDFQGNTQGSTLVLSRVRVSDTGRYSCYQGDTEIFSTRVTVAEPPETPQVSCYKRSPSSKIRCEWTPQKHVYKGTSCSLFIRKRSEEPFSRVPCSYSSHRSRCWCALDHISNERRTMHHVYMCVTSIMGNATSVIYPFTPMNIIKPDPPYNVSVQSEIGLNTTLVVKWKCPYSWKFQDQVYDLIYEIQYKPIQSAHFQTISEHRTRHIITDAQSGLEYEVKVRVREVYEGNWSEWSPAQYGSSWTGIFKTCLSVDNNQKWKDSPAEDLFPTPFPYIYEGSGTEDFTEESSAPTSQPRSVSRHYLWIIVPLELTLVILAVYIIRYKDKHMSNLQRLGVFAQCSDSVHPPPAPVTEGHALLNKDRPLIDMNDKNEQVLRNEERTGMKNFNNSSYFLVQREG